ncbi:MAG: efflux RND transporter periplasmic adaptor subunit [[Eubacterium] siraeum]|nr:efflux RND transporter periplasmic adaptor subunit [[Eubacterium] siraeum]
MKASKTIILKTLLILALMLTALYTAFVLPRDAESSIPAAAVFSPESQSYSPLVTAKGSITKKGGDWLAVVAVSEADISSVEIGQRVSVSGAALSEGEYTGEVTEIADNAYVSSAYGSTAQTVVDVTVKISGGDLSKLKTGYTATVKVQTGDDQTLDFLPYTAIQQDERGEYVYVLKNNTAVRRDIVTGIELTDKTQIISGIEKGDLVLDNPSEIKEGERVRVNDCK